MIEMILERKVRELLKLIKEEQKMLLSFIDKRKDWCRVTACHAQFKPRSRA